MTTLEITATEDETLIELPPGDVELKTPQELVFWSAAPDPSVRQGDHRSEVNRLHGGISVKLGSVPPGWKIAVSLRSDLPAEQPTRPEPPAPEQPPQLSEEEMAARQLARQIAKDMAEAETVNLAVDIIMAKLGKPVTPEPDRAFPAMTEPPGIEDVQAELSAALDEIDAVTAPPPDLDLNIIPDHLASYAQADESAEDFRNRLKGMWQRFGIEDGKNFVGGGEPLTSDEKIKMRDIDMLLNSEEGKNAGLLPWLYADEKKS